MTAVDVPADGERPVGRDAELAVLTRAVTALLHGRGSVVEITGEPGIGKTRLATALMELATRRGIPVVRARAVRGNTTSLQVFRDAWEARRADPRATAGAKTFDEFGDRPGKWAAGCALVLDDVHCCDADSVAAIVRLVRSQVPGPFLLALAHRPRQTAPELLEALEYGVQAGTVTRIEPGPLGPASVAALLTRRDAPGDPESRAAARSQDFASLVCAAAEGSPRYVRLLAAADWRPERWPDRPGTDTAGLLREAKPLIAEFDALTPQAAITASAAAVVGSPFRPEDTARVSGLGLDRTLDALAELERADLIRPADWKGNLAFRHPVVGHVAHERAGVSFRLRAHRRALELIADRGGRASEKARHAEHVLGMDAALATRTLAEGAAEIAAQDPATAAHWLRLALESLPAGGTEPTARTEMELACCRALIASGQLAEARTRAHELLGHRHASLGERQLLQAHAVCAAVERRLGRYAEAAALAGTALGQLPRPLPDPLPTEAAELVIEYGLVHVLGGTHDQVHALLREAVQTSLESDGADLTVLRVLNALCATHAGDLAEATAEVTRCVRLVDALPDPLAGRTPETLALLGSAELYLERFTDAARHLSRGLETDGTGSRQPILLHRLLGLAMAEQWTGRLDASERHAQEVESLARALDFRPAVTLAQAIHATTLVWSLGREYADKAVALVEEAPRATPHGHSWWTASATGLLAHARLLAGDAAGCRRTLLDSEGGNRMPPVRPFSRPFLLSLLATATLECGDHEEAHRLVRTAEADAERLGLPVQEAYTRRARALLHQADGEHDAAAKLLDLAADAFRAADMPVEHAWTLATGIRSFDIAQGRETALGHLDAAEALARTFGAALVQERVAQMRAELSEGDDTAHPLGLLSDREREIAELATTGLRTRQIAERLFLSPRTVETHLSRVYRKLGVSSRLALSDLLRRIG
ncbi:LuxR C-terminal-related transcriptional regulator [Streptomyces sp. JV178]|uniref:helix-turn-helix transcriptional regulator n=1 Tax=Streptomyces sp. JV178 TaxID=858632 RepID=UPI0015D56C6A|nr:LuxR C-terminal-related transcriptional regulator [Streptomyces sp. JV178]